MALNAASLTLPVILLGKFFTQASVGLYFQAHKVLSMPMSILGTAIGQVFLQKASLHKDDKVYLRELAFQAYKKLLLIGIGPISLITIFGDYIFAFVFGEEWRDSGRFAQFIGRWLLFVFTTSTLASAASSPTR